MGGSRLEVAGHRVEARRGAWGGVRGEAKSGVWRLGRTDEDGTGGGLVPGVVLAWRGGGAVGVGRGLDGSLSSGLRNEPNSWVFGFGRGSYGGVHLRLVLLPEGLATFQFREVGEV